jgi:hypothetical protein
MSALLRSFNERYVQKMTDLLESLACQELEMKGERREGKGNPSEISAG